MNSPVEYVGTELHLFRDARNWKHYLRAQIEPYLRGDVLEVGAGIGGTTAMLHDAAFASWTCLEPDPELVQELTVAAERFRDARGAPPMIVTGTLSALGRDLRYDSVLYVDVLEHIDDDRAELARAAERLRPGGHLIIVAPAHQGLFSPFDHAVGHFRRYDRRMLRERPPSGAELMRLRYLDSVGIAASLGNRLVTRASNPSTGQIAVWDRWMVPVSRVLDPVFAFALGKTVLAVWRL
jgi:SAM-dependent methyltransferase